MSDAIPTPSVAPSALEKKIKPRSPGYPAIGLSRAIELAQKFWDIDKRSAVLVSRAAPNLGFSVKSSAGLLAIAAMKRYGLLQEEGAGKDRKVRLTDLAISILNPSAPDREQLIKQAALRPGIHAQLWQKMSVDGASAGTLHDYLVFELEFLPAAAHALIEQFSDTAAFAKLTPSDKVEGSLEDEEGDEDQLPMFKQEIALPTPGGGPNPKRMPPSVQPTPLQATDLAAPAPPATPGAGKQLRMDLDSGPVIVNYPMSEEDFDLMVNTLNVWKTKLIKPPANSFLNSMFGFFPPQESASSAKRQPPQAFPANAIWRNKDHDMPVVVVEKYGEMNGETWYKTTTGTGICGSELTFSEVKEYSAS